MLDIKDRIRIVRKELKMTQEQFGEHIGIGKMAITYYENGNRVPSDRSIKAVSEKFGINENWLRTGEGDMYAEKDAHTIINERLAKVQIKALNDDKSAIFKERLASAILNMSDAGCEAMMELLEDMGYVKED